MFKQWVGCCSQNFHAGRNGCKPLAMVVHRTGGTLADIDGRCTQAGTFSSAHYAVGADGTVHQYVEETDTAFHAGVVVNPTWPLIQQNLNPNLYTLAIELEGNAGDAITDPQYTAAAALIAEMAARWQIAIDASHIVVHDEIRAGRRCPGDGFDRQELLNRVPAAGGGQSRSTDMEREIRILRNSNVREGAPSTAARVARVAAANSTETVSGFTDQGGRVQGNSCWYRTQDGNYIWSGTTDAPNPVQQARPIPVPLPTAALPAEAVSVACGIDSIDQLLDGQATVPLDLPSANQATIGALQDLLTCHGFSGLPTVLSTAYGTCGAKTTAAVAAFQQQQSLDAAAGIDRVMLRKMVTTPAADPRASTAYLALVLGFAPVGLQKVLSLVSQMEGAGKFAALNRNTDRAGLSFGLIQWAQKPGRLVEILAAMSQADRAQFVTVFGAGDPQLADALISHCRKPFGGVDPKTGDTTNPTFDLVADPWLSRFRQAALTARFQQVQVQTALSAFQVSYTALSRFAPNLISERAVGFMLDVANQFGNAGAEKLYGAVNRSGMSETDVLGAIADATVERVEDSIKTAVKNRRDQFLQTKYLSDNPFVPANRAAAANIGV